MGDDTKLTLERKIQLLLEAQLDIYATRVSPPDVCERCKPDENGERKSIGCLDHPKPKPLTDEDLAHIERIARISKILRMKAELGKDAAAAVQKVNTDDLLAELRKSKDPEMFPKRGRPSGPRPKIGDDAHVEG